MLTPAIPTIYKGVQLRSRMEAQCAILFDRLGWGWEYEPISVMLENGLSYTPDFYLPGIETFAECRGYRSRIGDAQIETFSEVFSDYMNCSMYLVIGPEETYLFDYKGISTPDFKYCFACRLWVLAPNRLPAMVCPRCDEASCVVERLVPQEGKLFFNFSPSDYWEEKWFAYEGQMERAVTGRLVGSSL